MTDLYILPTAEQELHELVRKNKSVLDDFQDFFVFMRNNVGIHPYDGILKYVGAQLPQYQGLLRRFKKTGSRCRCIYIWDKDKQPGPIIVKVWIRGTYAGHEKHEYRAVLKEVAATINRYSSLSDIVEVARQCPVKIIF